LTSFPAARDDNIRAARANSVRRKRNRLQTRRAITINRHRRNFDRQTGFNRAVRATFIPCSASGNAQPIITSSICDASKPSARLPLPESPPRPFHPGRVFFKVPFGAFPTAVRTADTITASFIFVFPFVNSNQFFINEFCLKTLPFFITKRTF
jgi:hypothetical protein